MNLLSRVQAGRSGFRVSELELKAFWGLLEPFRALGLVKVWRVLLVKGGFYVVVKLRPIRCWFSASVSEFVILSKRNKSCSAA